MSGTGEFEAKANEVGRMIEGDRGVLAAIARAHYIDELSRTEIAEMLGMSRFKVSRLLTRAREEGIVSIRINDSGLPDPVLAERLKSELGLEHCDVIRTFGDGDSARQQIGASAATLLSSTLRENEVLGVSWGRTLTATAQQLEYLPRLSVVQLTGFVAGDLAASPIEVVRHTSAKSGGDVHPIFAPLFVQDVETAEGLRKHPDIHAAMALFPRVTTALLSVGSWEPPDTQVRDVLAIDDLAAAISGGCVADIAGILITGEGQPVDTDLQKRSIAIFYDQLRNVPRVIAVAGGASKARAIRTVARAGLITELVTDHELALAILGDARA
ncbi:sugar-binding domain-containing protein [Microbacterium sp.]|uniref:sugar-binding transcriptional regulator n=1 Tax=Microbacterium sp. TaxID=51671 RepID=UPI002810EBC8|nr:sugar-binding domain-containing protein [Microbacterium sp.]